MPGDGHLRGHLGHYGLGVTTRAEHDRTGLRYGSDVTDSGCSSPT